MRLPLTELKYSPMKNLCHRYVIFMAKPQLPRATRLLKNLYADFAMPQVRIIYWDSCIFLAWLKDEKRPNHEMDGIYECVREVEIGKTRLITSVITKIEVYE